MSTLGDRKTQLTVPTFMLLPAGMERFSHAVFMLGERITELTVSTFISLPAGIDRFSRAVFMLGDQITQSVVQCSDEPQLVGRQGPVDGISQPFEGCQESLMPGILGEARIIHGQ
jgi:hypothetical protein